MKLLMSAVLSVIFGGLIGCSFAYALDVDATTEAINVVVQGASSAAPFLPSWAGVVMTVIGGLWGLFVTVIRPEVPADKWEKLGKTGMVLDKLAGNRKHTMNAPQANPLDKKTWPRNL